MGILPKLRFGIIGFGLHAHRVMVPAFQESTQAELVAIGTAGGLEKVRQLSQTFPDYQIHESYQALLDNPNVDVVYIGLPNHLHAEWSIKSCAAGKHVLCDKPLALSSAEVREMLSARDKAKVKLLEAFMYRFHPQHRAVKQMIADGEIGEIRLFEAHYHYFLDDPSNIRLQVQAGGGGLYDVGCYVFDCARFILQQEPTTISGTWSIDEASGVDGSASFQLLFPNNAVAHVTCGCKLPRMNSYAVYGTKGVIRVLQAFTIPRNKTASIVLEKEASKAVEIQIPPANQYQLEIDHFCRWVLEEKLPPGLIQTGLENSLILDAARVAATSGKLVVIRPNGARD